MSEIKNIRRNFLFFTLGSVLSLVLCQLLDAQNYSASTYRPTPVAYVPTEDEAFSWSSLNSLADDSAQNQPQNHAQNSAFEIEDLTVGEMLEAQSMNSGANVAFASHDETVAPSRQNAVAGRAPSDRRAANAGYSVPQNPTSSAYAPNAPQNAYSPAPVQLAAYDALPQTAPKSDNSAVAPTNPPASLATQNQTTLNPATLNLPATSSNANRVQTSPNLPHDFPDGAPSLDSRGLIAFSETLSISGSPFQQITLVDPTQKVLCVYHINMTTGQIELKSARKIEWDLQLIYLNSQKPLPQDVQAILKQNQRKR